MVELCKNLEIVPEVESKFKNEKRVREVSKPEISKVLNIS